MSLNLEHFRISEKTGYVLEDPLALLPKPYEAWAELARLVPEYIESNVLRQKVEQLPVLDASLLFNDYKALRLAHLELITLAAGYIWCNGEEGVPAVLPKSIAVPLYDVSQKLGVQPAICHASLCLSNLFKKDPNLPICINNAEVKFGRFLKDYGQDWFYIVTTQLDLDFASALCAIARGVDAASDPNNNTTDDDLIYCLNEVKASLEKMKCSIKRMGEHLTADVFFTGIRRYLGGYNTKAFAKHGGGLIFEGVSTVPFSTGSASAAQSPALQTADAFLGLTYDSLTYKSNVLEFREYMIPEHKAFIEHLERTSAVRSLANSSDNEMLRKAYNDCVETLGELRTEHIRTVAKFIIVPKNKQTKADSTTGGSGKSVNVMPFLKEMRNHTHANLLTGCEPLVKDI